MYQLVSHKGLFSIVRKTMGGFPSGVHFVPHDREKPGNRMICEICKRSKMTEDKRVNWLKHCFSDDCILITLEHYQDTIKRWQHAAMQ